MKLYYSLNSPFSRIARITARELELITSIEELTAANRQPDNPVLEFSSVGRVPTLVDGDLVITETKNVVQYLASQSDLQNKDAVTKSDWKELMQEGQILGFADGIGCWVRENRREPELVSSHLVNVEFERSRRCLDYFEKEAVTDRIGEFPVFRFIVLAAGLDLMNFHHFHPNWQDKYPKLSIWFEAVKLRQSMKETAPI